MSLLGFGQPQAGVFQMAYIVEDIEASMRRWIDEPRSRWLTPATCSSS